MGKMDYLGHVNELLTVPYYRRSPLEALRYSYAKLKFAHGRVFTPHEFLRSIGISMSDALEGYSHWQRTLENAVLRVRDKQGQQGGVSLEDGIVLYGIVRSLKPDVVIETGVAAGVSNSFLNAALIENGSGTLYSIELPPARSAAGMHQDGGIFAWPKSGVGWAVPPAIREAIGGRNVLILDDVRSALPALLKSVPDVDVFFHDDLHTPDHMLWEYQTIWPHMKSGGVLVSDDSNFSWFQFCREQRISRPASTNLQRMTAIRKP
jgi:hypothetical protein